MKLSKSVRNAFAVSAAAMAMLALAIYGGSGALRHFDPALTAYALISVLAVGAVSFRLTLWLSRPPTRIVFERAITNIRLLIGRRETGDNEFFPDTLPGAAADAAVTTASSYGLQNFIRKRATLRWVTHLCLSYGSLLAFAVAFPLVFGWVHFETPTDHVSAYRVIALGIPLGTFAVDSFPMKLAFNALNIAGVLVLMGVILAAIRRLRDPGEQATQRFIQDWMPLIVLFFVATTGLSLTFSTHVLGGWGFTGFAASHLICVAALLLYIPYSKLFHMFQRSAHLAVQFNRKQAERNGPARCFRCGAPYASLDQIEDLKRTLGELGTRYIYGTRLHYQDVCPRCRRGLLAVNQARTFGGSAWTR